MVTLGSIEVTVIDGSALVYLVTRYMTSPIDTFRLALMNGLIKAIDKQLFTAP